MTAQELAKKIRVGEVDCNNQSLFFSILSKGLLMEMNNNISIRKSPIPHYILNTGDETMVLETKGQDHSKEPLEITNENYIYTKTPRCVVTPKGINLITDQLTNPYANGVFQFDDGENVYTFTSEFRRMPLNITYDLQYLVDSYTDSLELVQQIITKLAFVRTFNITYMGQVIRCSYNIPESFDGEHMIEFDETSQDDRRRKLSFEITVETNIPVFNERTVIPADQYIKHHAFDLKEYNRGGIEMGGPHDSQKFKD